jgi:chromosomal replication initiation ATPase DnaA
MKFLLLAKAAAEFYKVPLEQLKGKRRREIYTKPRHVCQWIAKDAGYSNSVIALFFKCDPTAVHYGVKKAQNRIDTSPKEAAEIKEFMEFAKKYSDEN